MQNFCLSEAILERFKMAEQDLGYSEHIVKLNCDSIDTWEFRERKSFELGNIDDLALSIKHGGQYQPIVLVRASSLFKPKDNYSAQYVVIAGYRRWLACKKSNLEVSAVVRALTFEQAIMVLASENESEVISEYSKGMLYSSLLRTQHISEGQISQQLNISLDTLHAYLAFANVPEKIWLAAGDVSRVSAKTALAVLSIAKKGPSYVDALVRIAKKIAHGYGEKRIQDEVDHIINKMLRRLPQIKEGEHHIKFNGKVIMNVHHGKIKLDKSLMADPHYSDLVSKIEQDITDFASAYLQKH